MRRAAVWLLSLVVAATAVVAVPAIVPSEIRIVGFTLQAAGATAACASMRVTMIASSGMNVAAVPVAVSDAMYEVHTCVPAGPATP